MAFARAALKPQDIHLYQCQAWAKFTREADYTQPLHRDFANHTLTVSSENTANNSEAILCYFSDVGEAHGPATLLGPTARRLQDLKRLFQLTLLYSKTLAPMPV